MEVQKKFMEDMKWGLDNYINLQLKFRDLWVAIMNKEVVVAGEDLKYVKEKASKITGKRKEEIPVIFVESGAHVLKIYSRHLRFISTLNLVWHTWRRNKTKKFVDTD